MKPKRVGRRNPLVAGSSTELMFEGGVDEITGSPHHQFTRSQGTIQSLVGFRAQASCEFRGL